MACTYHTTGWLKAVREGKLAVHLVDNKIQLKVEEVLNLFFPKGLFD